jgi:hypothetical protein
MEICNPGLQFFHVSNIREITLIRSHLAVFLLYVFAVRLTDADFALFWILLS